MRIYTKKQVTLDFIFPKMKDFFLKQFQHYKELGDETFEQLNDAEVLWQYNPESSSISSIVKDFSGNMISRWTFFPAATGEKESRNKAEFENDIPSKVVLLEVWEKGWTVFFMALNKYSEDDLNDVLSICGKKNSLLEPFLEELANYSFHLGQIVYVAKMVKNEENKTLIISKSKLKLETTENLKKQSFSGIHQNSSPVCYAKSEEVRDDYKIE